MRNYSLPALAIVVCWLALYAFPSAHSDLPFPGVRQALADGQPTVRSSSRPGELHQSTAGNYAIRVYDGGTYADDAVILPVFEVLEARYAAQGQEFTIEYWFKLAPGYDSNGRELFDHHVPSNEGFWTAFQNNQLWAGMDAEEGNDDGSDDAIHLRAGSGFNDGAWHHYALVRDLDASPDRLCLYLDGVGACYVDDAGDRFASVSSEIRPLLNRDGNADNNKPLYVIGTRTNGSGEIAAVIDELRISDVARYRNDFTPPDTSFDPDGNTVMLFHFDEGSGNKSYGLSSTSGPTLEATLVETFSNYGLDVTPLDPGDPTDAAWLDQMWVPGRFPPTLALNSPNGGELWLTASQHQITWRPGVSATNVSLSYSTDGFTLINHTIVASMSNTGVYTWMTPVTPSRTMRVRVADVVSPTIFDDSDANFFLTDVFYNIHLPIIFKAG